jgi:hypothetical protein
MVTRARLLRGEGGHRAFVDHRRCRQVALFINGPLASDGKDVQSNLHIGGVATDGSETIRRHMTWGARMPQIAVGDMISVHVLNVPPQTAEAPDSNNDLERNAFEAAKAKHLELKPKYEP